MRYRAYKLSLAEWLPDGCIFLPVNNIAERWIYYYWPLFEDCAFFIPQIRGESAESRLRIGFRRQLEDLIKSFHRSGGLEGFAIALRNDSFDTPQKEGINQLPLLFANLPGKTRNCELLIYESKPRGLTQISDVH